MENSQATRGEDKPQRRRPPFPKNRFEAISDGVFSVALTLLVVDIATTGLPHLAKEHWFGEFWPRLASFVYSFVVVGIYWVAHHNEMNMVKSIPGRIPLWLNLFFLFWIVCIPFSAAFLGSNWNVVLDAADEFGRTTGIARTSVTPLGHIDPGFRYRRVPFITYAVNLWLAGVTLQWVWHFISGHRNCLDYNHLHEVDETTKRNRLIPNATLIAFGIGLLLPSEWAPVPLVIVPLLYAGWTLWLAWSKGRRTGKG